MKKLLIDRNERFLNRFVIIGIMFSLLACSREIKDFFNTDDNNKMYYESYGSGDIAIVFIHGWSVTCRSWDGQIDFFKDENKVILIDLPRIVQGGIKNCIQIFAVYVRIPRKKCRLFY